MFFWANAEWVVPEWLYFSRGNTPLIYIHHIKGP
jgi:hypothetical protein